MDKQQLRELEALFIFTDYSLKRKLVKLLQKQKLPVLMLTHGYGSANTKIYEILGYGEPKKIIGLGIQTKEMSEQIIENLKAKMNFCERGRGIAFTVSLSSINASVLAVAEEEASKHLNIRSEDMTPKKKEEHHLIISIVNTGFFEQVMEAAKSVGATGGTLIHARGLGSKKAVKYLGITIQPEKDLILILAPEDKKLAIMAKITEEVGLNTDGNGICFSLPVNNVVGLERYKISED